MQVPAPTQHRSEHELVLRSLQIGSALQVPDSLLHEPVHRKQTDEEPPC